MYFLLINRHLFNNKMLKQINMSLFNIIDNYFCILIDFNLYLIILNLTYNK